MISGGQACLSYTQTPRGFIRNSEVPYKEPHHSITRIGCSPLLIQVRMRAPDAILIQPTEALPMLRIWNLFSEANDVCYEVYCGDFSKSSHWQRKLRGGGPGFYLDDNQGKTVCNNYAMVVQPAHRIPCL